MTWMYQGKAIEDLPDGCIGFVYLITNGVSGRKYIGQKLALSSKPRFRSVRLKNGTRKTIRLPGQTTNDWKAYFGSSQELLEDLANLRPEDFIREILYFCTSRSECSYLEAKEQFDRDALLKDEYYNKLIDCKIHANNLQK